MGHLGEIQMNSRSRKPEAQKGHLAAGQGITVLFRPSSADLDRFPEVRRGSVKNASPAFFASERQEFSHRRRQRLHPSRTGNGGFPGQGFPTLVCQANPS